MDNKHKYQSLIKNTLIFALGNVGSKLILFLLVPLYTNYMTTSEYGTADLIFTVGQIIIPFASFGIFAAVIRFGISKKYITENVLNNSIAIVSVGSLIVLCLAPLLNYYNALADWKWLLVLYVISNLYASVILNYLKAKEFNRTYSLISVVRTLVLALLNIVFIAILKNGITGYILSTILSSVFAIIIALVFGNLFTDIRRGKLDWGLIVEILHFSFPLILNGISWWIIHSSDKIMIELMISASALGIYSVAGKIPSVINVIVSIFAQAWDISSIKEMEGDNDNSFFTSVFNKYMTLIFMATILASALCKPFMAVYVGKSFNSSWMYIPLLLVSAAFGSIGSFFGSFFGPLNKNGIVMISTVTGGIVNILINFIAIPYLGIWGAVIGTVVSYIILGLFRMFAALKYVKIYIPWPAFIINLVVIVLQATLISLHVNIFIVSILAVLIFSVLNRNALKELSSDVSNVIQKFIRS